MGKSLRDKIKELPIERQKKIEARAQELIAQELQRQGKRTSFLGNLLSIGLFRYFASLIFFGSLAQQGIQLDAALDLKTKNKTQKIHN